MLYGYLNRAFRRISVISPLCQGFNVRIFRYLRKIEVNREDRILFLRGMIKATQNNLKKAETVFKSAGFRVRYGKGNFQAGLAQLDDKNNIVINRMFTIDARLNCLIDLLSKIELDTTDFDEGDLKFYDEMIKTAHKKKEAAKKKAAKAEASNSE